MATYTATELKDYTSVPAVKSWSDDKILLFQQTAESILTNLDLDTTQDGYGDAYNSAVVALFDWLADNPTSLKSSTQGRVSKDFTIDDLPATVSMLLKKYTGGSQGTFSPAHFSRKDIGLR